MEVGVVLGTSQAEPGSAFPPRTPGFVVADRGCFEIVGGGMEDATEPGTIDFAVLPGSVAFGVRH